MDVVDVAGDTIEVCVADAERRARGHSAPEKDPRFDGWHCVEEDCGQEIPPERVALGRIRCVECQTLLERKRLH